MQGTVILVLLYRLPFTVVPSFEYYAELAFCSKLRTTVKVTCAIVLGITVVSRAVKMASQLDTQ